MRTAAAVIVLITLSTTGTVLAQGWSPPPTRVCELGSYACPNHLEIQATWPARCPTCGTVLIAARGGGGAAGGAAGGGAGSTPAGGTPAVEPRGGGRPGVQFPSPGTTGRGEGREGEFSEGGRFGFPNEGFGDQNRRFGFPNEGFGDQNRRFGFPNEGFGDQNRRFGFPNEGFGDQGFGDRGFGEGGFGDEFPNEGFGERGFRGDRFGRGEFGEGEFGDEFGEQFPNQSFGFSPRRIRKSETDKPETQQCYHRRNVRETDRESMHRQLKGRSYHEDSAYHYGSDRGSRRVYDPGPGPGDPKRHKQRLGTPVAAANPRARVRLLPMPQSSGNSGDVARPVSHVRDDVAGGSVMEHCRGHGARGRHQLPR